MITGIAISAVLVASFYATSGLFVQKASAQNSTANKAGNPSIAPANAENASKSPTAVGGGNKTSPSTAAAAGNMSSTTNSTSK
ncbi:MAG TPA: hypothetical protein VI278_15420 [Nitrososphaeraceae archaeon]